MPNPHVLEGQMDELKSDMKEIRTSVSKIADAMSKLAVLEEKNHVFATTLEKVVMRVERMEDRHREDAGLREAVIRNTQRIEAVETKAGRTEMEQVKFTANVEGISKTMKVMWTAFGGGVIYLGSQAISFFTHLPASLPIKP